MNQFRVLRPLCLALVVLGITAGCTSSDEPFTASNGARGYRVYCGGMPYTSYRDCESRAASLCPGEYTVLQDHDTPYGHSESMWESSTHTLTVVCKPE